MKAYKETILTREDTFPVEIFVKDNTVENITVGAHWHDCVEVLCFLEGSAVQLVNEHLFEVKANDVVIVNYGDIHRTTCKKDQVCKVLVLKFMPQLIGDTVSFIDSKYIHLFLNTSEGRTPYIKNAAAKDSRLYQFFLNIHREYENGKQAYEMMIKGYIYQIIGLLIRNGSIDHVDKAIDRELFVEIQPVLRYLEDNYMKPVQMEAMARMSNLSYYHFSRKFKKAIGCNFKEFLDGIRIAEAERLMISTKMNITDIAFEVGYINVSTFNRTYRRIKGITPSKMRQLRLDGY